MSSPLRRKIYPLKRRIYSLPGFDLKYIPYITNIPTSPRYISIPHFPIEKRAIIQDVTDPRTFSWSQQTLANALEEIIEHDRVIESKIIKHPLFLKIKQIFDEFFDTDFSNKDAGNLVYLISKGSKCFNGTYMFQGPFWKQKHIQFFKKDVDLVGYDLISQIGTDLNK